MRLRTPSTWLFLLALGTCQAEDASLTPADLPPSSFTWNQEELIVGFSRWDEVVPGRAVEAGSTPAPLDDGSPLPGFAPGERMAVELERFMDEQKTAGILVLHDGSVRLERYGLGHSRAGRWMSQSVAKSFTSTLVGAAIADGYIESLDDPVSAYVEGLVDSAYDSVTVRQLLTMTSGVRWIEDYTDPSSDIQRFYGAPTVEGLGATVSYMRTLPRESPPGERWVYNTGETHLLGALVSGAVGRPLADYLSEKIWRPLGMEQGATWTIDRTGDELGGCCLHASLRDYARFGQLALDDGVIDGESIVPDGWFDAATTSQMEIGGERGYGYQWWTYADGTYSAIGIHGQLIWVDPSRRLVIAINSAWPEALSGPRGRARGDLIRAVVEAVDQEVGE